MCENTTFASAFKREGDANEIMRTDRLSVKEGRVTSKYLTLACVKGARKSRNPSRSAPKNISEKLSEIFGGIKKLVYLCIRFPKIREQYKEEFFERFTDKQLVVQVFTYQYDK